MSFLKTPAELSEPRAPTSFAQPPKTGQPHHHHRHHSQHQMTPAQARRAYFACVAALSGSPQPVVPPSATQRTMYYAPVPLNIDPAPRPPITGGVGASRDPRLRLANVQTVTTPIPASPTPPRTATYVSPALLSADSSRAGLSVSHEPSRSDVRVNTVTDNPIFPTPSLEVMETMAGPQRKKRSSNEATGEAKRYYDSRSQPLDSLNESMSLPNIRAAMTDPAPNESRTKEPKEGQCVGSSKTPAESSNPQAPTSSAQPPTTGQPHPQHQMTPAQARPASSASVVAPSDLRSLPLDNLNTMDNAGVSCVVPGPQDAERSRNFWDLCYVLALAIQSNVNALASQAASGLQDSELSRNMLDSNFTLVEALRSMVVAYTSHEAFGISQFRQLSPYSESNPSEPKKDEKKPLKTKNKPNKKLEALNKKISKHKAIINKSIEEKRELRISTMKDKAEKRLEKRKSLMERDHEIIKRLHENLKRPTDQ